MTMRNLTLLAMAGLTAGLGIGTAAAEPTWGGFYVDGAIGARSTTTDMKSTQNISYSYQNGFGGQVSGNETFLTSTDAGSTDFLGQISAGWRWDSGQIVAGVGVFADLAGDDAGKTTEQYRDTWSYSSGAFASTEEFAYFSQTELKQTSRYGISLDIGPAWRTHPYLKLAYAWSDFEVKGSNNCGGTGGGPTALSFDETYSGLGIGGGVRHLHNENLYFFAEAMWQDLGSKSFTGTPMCSNPPPDYPGSASATGKYEFEPTNLTGVIGVGWKF
jgi:hypothetical protein